MFRSPAFQFYPKDWLSDPNIMLMDWECRGMYIHLLCIAWFQNPPGTLPNDDVQIMQFLGISLSKNSSFTKYETKLKNKLLANFTLDENPDSPTFNKLVHEGLSLEFLKQKSFKESRSENAKKRWNAMQVHNGSNASAMQVQCFASSSPDIKTKAKSISVGLHTVHTDAHTQKPRSRFEEFWSIYPRKENKKRASEVWQRKKLDAKADFIITDVGNRKQRHRQWQEGFIPHATTYLNGERWNDEINEVANATGQPKQQSAHAKAFELILADAAKDREQIRATQESDEFSGMDE